MADPKPQLALCDVCGRTMLAGERTYAYLTRDGEPRTVCELCRPRAEGVGWMQAGASRPTRAAPSSPGSRIQEALDQFNASTHARTVAGLTKTLGTPQVSAGTAAKAPSEVRVTVAWELSWYQWVIDLSEQPPALRQTGRGDELSQLDGPSREWNARADEHGHLHLGLAA